MNRTRKDGKCKRGHLVAGDNAYEYALGKFRCKKCHAERAKAYYLSEVSVEYGGQVKKAMESIGMGLSWNEFQVHCQQEGLDTWDTLSTLLKLPLVLLQVNPDALNKYMETVANEKPGRRLEALNYFLARFGRPEEDLKPTPAISGEGSSDIQSDVHF